MIIQASYIYIYVYPILSASYISLFKRALRRRPRADEIVCEVCRASTRFYAGASAIALEDGTRGHEVQNNIFNQNSG